MENSQLGACCPEHIDKNACLIQAGKEGKVVAFSQQYGHLSVPNQYL